jgi:GT2 family glycosyltransferase
MPTTSIALSICTCDRPEGLRRTLDAVARLDFDGTLRVVVVDNHAGLAGLAVCAAMAPSYRFPLVSLHEPTPGIAAARNAALREALCGEAEFVATLDDDGRPDRSWLALLLATQARTGADFVCGAIEPEFEGRPPAWARTSGLFSYRPRPTTANALVRARVLHTHGYAWFDERFGLSGGEDAHFFGALADAGRSYASCAAAVVYEHVPRSRVGAGYILRRALRNGSVNIRIERQRPHRRGAAARLAGALAKVGHGGHHLVRSAVQPWRFFRALDDLAEGAGMVLGEFGYVHPFYAGLHPGARARRGSMPIAAPAIRTGRALLRVRCFDDWGDFDDALAHLTPGGRGVWEDVAFVRADAPRPDWIGVFNCPRGDRVRVQASPNRVFFAIGEPPTDVFREMHAGQGEGTFVLTPDEAMVHRSEHPRCYVLSASMTRTWTVRRTLDALRRQRVTAKPGRLSWITSDLNQMRGHRYRLDFLARLRPRVEFDLYGRGFRPIADKWDALAPYRYSIAFENTRAGYYFTEKLMDCFVAETMPLYYGSPLIARFFPEEAMVIIDPDDPDVFAKIEDAVRSDLWLKRKDAILEAKRRVLEDYNIFARLARFVREHDAVSGSARRFTFRPVPIDYREP